MSGKKNPKPAAEPQQAVSTEVVPHVEAQTGGALTPMELIGRAIQSGADVESLDKLMELQERWDKNQAKKAYDNAISAAKAEIPVIIKNRRVQFDSRKAGAASTDYAHEDMAAIAEVIDPILSKNGLSYRFNTTAEIDAPISVTCIIAHRDGHREETTLKGPRDTSGNKNSIQAVGSTVTYLQRYTLKAALGLAVAGDDDGRSSEDQVEDELSEEQLIQLRELAESVDADIPIFCEYMSKATKRTIEKLSDIKVSELEKAQSALKAKAQKGKK